MLRPIPGGRAVQIEILPGWNYPRKGLAVFKPLHKEGSFSGIRHAYTDQIGGVALRSRSSYCGYIVEIRLSLLYFGVPKAGNQAIGLEAGVSVYFVVRCSSCGGNLPLEIHSRSIRRAAQVLGRRTGFKGSCKGPDFGGIKLRILMGDHLPEILLVVAQRAFKLPVIRCNAAGQALQVVGIRSQLQVKAAALAYPAQVPVYRNAACAIMGIGLYRRVVLGCDIKLDIAAVVFQVKPRKRRV
mgnify:CR=1 FL=1